MNQARCSICGEQRDRDDFSVLEQQEDGTYAICWDCHNDGRAVE